MIRPVAAIATLALVTAQASAQEAPADEVAEEVTEEPWPPEPSAMDWATFEGQVGPLLADLRQDRASGRNYARPPERGTEGVIHDVALAIRRQLAANACWAEGAAVTPGRRETIAIAVRFRMDGRFVEEPRLVSPPAMPEDDLALQGFIERTFAALQACNVSGLTLPAKYYEDPIWVYFIVQSRPE